MRNKILKNIVNKEGLPLNILELEKDITRAVTTLRDVGYFYAKFKNKNQNSIVKYQSNFTQADIYLDFDPGKLLRADEFIYVGNIVTKKIVLERELDIKVGDVVTPEKIKSIRDSLNSLGVFSKVSVLTSVTNLHNNDEEYKARLVVKLRERALGRVEIAPGYRTDLGAKFSFSFFKNNLWGLNHSFNTRLLLNRRFTFDELDQKRLGTNREHEIEGLAKVTYSWPYLFNSVNFDANITFQRRRFYSFDADIIRISPQFSKQFNKYFATSLKYQFEQIRQHRASNIDNNATFRIGGLTSAITLDFRDNRISPRSGSYYGLSWEFANPYFGSLKDENIEINFSKLISRNRFYLPFFNKKLVFALSISGGYQRNYATDTIASGSGGLKSRGYIPSIKVFRLDGYDLVRGFADSEINRLDSGEDISQTRIEGSAYFTNIKFEPRYYVSDNFVLGFFADAGRIFVNNYKPSDLRTAVGLSFKLLTPVGTLDFDYGVKTRRKLFSSFREDFGRFHLNIGTF
jgi:outer membrane protein insertion porin family